MTLTPTKVTMEIRVCQHMDFSDEEHPFPVDGQYNLQGEVVYEGHGLRRSIRVMSPSFSEFEKEKRREWEAELLADLAKRLSRFLAELKVPL